MSKTKGDESWVDEITDSESEDMPSSSTKLKRTSTDEDLYLKIIQEDGVVMEHVSCDVKKANVTSGSSSVQPQEVITLDDKDSCEDEMVNQYLDDIERKLEENIKKKSQTKNTTDDWKVVDYFRDIIYVEDDDPGSKSTKIKQRNKRIECKRRRQVYASPSQDGVKRRRRKANVSLSDGEIISDDDLILSDISLSPEPSSSSVRHRRDKHVEDNRRGSDYSRSGVRARQETEKNRPRNNRCDKYRSRSNRDYDSSIESSDQSPVCEVREKKRIVLLPEPIHSRYPEHRSHRHNSGTLEQSDYKEDRHSRKYQHEISPEQVPKKKSSKKHESKKHKSETKRGVKSKSSSDYFDEDKYHGSDKSRIRTLKKKYDEYLKYAKKFKNEDNDSDHIEKFVKMRSKLREDDGKKLLESTEASIDYKKEEEKFLRSLETYLEIKKKQEKSMSSSTQSLLMSSSSSKEYDPENISSEEEEYVPEKFTPENMALGRVEEYDPCSVSKVNNLTYEPTKIDEYEPTTLPLDEEYCPMPVKTNLPITYNPTKVYGGTNVCQSMPGGVRHPGWTNPTAQHPTIPKQLNPNIRLNKANLNPTEYKPAHKVISKNTVFIGNTVNPIALNQNANLIPMKPINVPPPTTSIDKTRIMSKLVNEKLLEIEKKKRQLLEEINRKKLLKIKEKCDEVALKKLEQKKLDLMEEINKKSNSVLKPIVNKVDGTSQANFDGIRKTVVDTTKTNVVCNQVTPVGPSNIKIKQEKLDTNTAPINNINEKLAALKKKQADLMSQIQSKLSKNTEMVIKEKADVTSKLEALERNKSALIQQLNKKQAEISNEAIVIKKEKVNPIESNVTGSATTSVVSNSENSSSSEKTIQIKQEKITPSEKPVVKMTEKSTIVQGTIRVKTVPAINEKLSDLEQKKAKLMAEIAAKSNKVGGVMTASVEKETLNEKLSRLAKEKEQLLANIEKKKNQTIAAPAISNKPIASVDKKRKPAPSVDMKSIPSQSATINEVKIKLEKEDNSSVQSNQIKIKQEKVDPDNAIAQVKPKIESQKQDTNSLQSMTPEDLAAKINELEKQKAQLMQTLAKKLPLHGNKSISPSKGTVSSPVSGHVKVTNVNPVKTNLKKPPVEIVKLAGQMKLKVNQQLSEITKKKMELMKQITSKSMNKSEAIKVEQSSSTTAVPVNVNNKLQELEKNKLKLLMEIHKKTTNKKIRDKENIVEKVPGDTNVIVKSRDQISEEIACKENTNTQACQKHDKELSTFTNDDATFKIPAVPALRPMMTKKSLGICRKNKIMKSKMKTSKHPRSGLKTMLSRKKMSMLKRFRKLNALNALLSKSSLLNAMTPMVPSNENQPTESPAKNSKSTQDSTVGDNPPSSDDTKAVESSETNAVSAEPIEPINESNQDESTDDIEILDPPPPVPKELITIEDQTSQETEVTPKQEAKRAPIEENIDDSERDMDSNEEETSSSEFITLKFIKVEKLSDLDANDVDNGDDKPNDGDGDVENNDADLSQMNQEPHRDSHSDVPGNDDQEELSDDKAEDDNVDNKEVTSETDIYVEDTFDATIYVDGTVETTVTRKDLKTFLADSGNFPLDPAEDDVVFLEETENSHSKNTIVPEDNGKENESLNMFSKNAVRLSPRFGNSPVVARLILNNKRKLIRGCLKNDKNSKLMKPSESFKMSKFKFVRSNLLKPSCERSFGRKLVRNKQGKASIPHVEIHPSSLICPNSNKLRRRKLDAVSETKTELKPVERKFRKNPSAYKLENKPDRYKLDNSKTKLRTNAVYKTEEGPKGEPTSNATAKVINCNENARQSSVITKFKLVRKSNAKLSTYKTLPPSIRRQVVNRFQFTKVVNKLNSTSSEASHKYRTCNRKSIRRHSKSKAIDASQTKSSDARTSLGKLTKSKYKIWRVLTRTQSSDAKLNVKNASKPKEPRSQHEARYTNRILRLPTSRKYHLNNKSPSRSLMKTSQSKLNHSISKYRISSLPKANRLVSKYKMIRCTNQRERNKINLSHRRQDSSYPNRTMKVISLNGASYKVSSRSLRRKISACLEQGPQSSPLLPSPGPARRSFIAQHLSGNIFSNRQIIGRHHLTSSRLRSLAVLTSRLRKNNAMSLSQTYQTSRAPNSPREGFLKGSHLKYKMVGGCHAMKPKISARGHGASSRYNSQSKQTYRNLTYTSPAEALKSRRTSRHRQQRRTSRHRQQRRTSQQRRTRRKYSSALISPHPSTSRHYSEQTNRYGGIDSTNRYRDIDSPNRYGIESPKRYGIDSPKRYEDSEETYDSDLKHEVIDSPNRYIDSPSPNRNGHSEIDSLGPVDSSIRYFDSDNPRSNIRPTDEECVETVIPRRVRKVGHLPGFIPL
ncbi:hypothetical protein M8J76_003326 [Diaphorina citri]|nr:hypothetical protein M8J76_003326 [Diaphorina citri]